MSTDAQAQAALASTERAAIVTPAALAILLGLFLVWGTGFAQSATLHSAAHDSRHSFAVPCH